MHHRQGSLIAFSSLSALYNVLVARPLFVRERSNAYYRFVLHRTHQHTDLTWVHASQSTGLVARPLRL
jgi:hypothetical protein